MKLLIIISDLDHQNIIYRDKMIILHLMIISESLMSLKANPHSDLIIRKDLNLIFRILKK